MKTKLNYAAAKKNSKQMTSPKGKAKSVPQRKSNKTMTGEELLDKAVKKFRK